MGRILKVVTLTVLLFTATMYVLPTEWSDIVYADESAFPMGLTPVDDSGTILTMEDGKTNIHVNIGFLELDLSGSDRKTQGWLKSICANKRSPCRVVDHLEIIFNNNSVFIHRNAYFNLSNINYAGLKKEENKYFIIFIGEDGAACFVAKLEFDQNSVKSRVLLSCTDPGDPLEKTSYHTIVFK